MQNIGGPQRSNTFETLSMMPAQEGVRPLLSLPHSLTQLQLLLQPLPQPRHPEVSPVHLS
ncbi:hypothetical protein EK904_014318 [Melospiza melodia maxima]|nr:hypothetical protein EK904_014318 [Melospiza melodia maxima]